MVAIKSLCILLILAIVVFASVVDALNPTLMLQLVNQERAKVRARPLTLDR